MKEVTISARIPEDLNEQLSNLAQALRRNRSWIIKEAIRGYVASEKQFLEAVEEGIQDMEAGRVIPHETVMRDIDELLSRYPASGE